MAIFPNNMSMYNNFDDAFHRQIQLRNRDAMNLRNAQNVAQLLPPQGNSMMNSIRPQARQFQQQAPKQGLFGKFNNAMGNLPMSGNLGLLAAGASLLEGGKIGDAVQAGLGTYQGLSEMEERKKRQAAMAKLVEQYGDDPKLMQLLQASPDGGASLLAQLELQKRKQKEAKARITKQDANNRLRFVDDGTLVFPDVTKESELKNITTKNWLAADADIVIGDRTIKKGQTFALNMADDDAVKAAILGGAIEAPERMITMTESGDDNIVPQEVDIETPVIDLSKAAGGDLTGISTDAINKFVGFFGGNFDQPRKEQIATINALNNTIREPLVKALSARGAVYTQEQVNELLPMSNLNDGTFIARAEALMPRLKDVIKSLNITLRHTKNTVERGEAKADKETVLRYMEAMEKAIESYRSQDTSSKLFEEADALLKD